MPLQADTAREVLLIYDGECPLCDAYCRAARIRESLGTLQLVDARQPGAVVDELTRKGLDIDQGMALKVGATLYYGADAICALALLSTRSGIFNRCNYWLFQSGSRSHLLYPLLRSCRNLLLKLLRRTKINNLGAPGNSYF